MISAKTFTIGTLLLVCASATSAAEIRLRSDCQPKRAIVLLGDVADVTAASSAERKRLEAIELFPAPPAGGRKTLRRRELMDTLSLRGIDWSETQLVGSSVVDIQMPRDERGADGGHVADNIRRRVEQLVSNVIVEFLRTSVADRMPWEVDATVPPEIVQSIVGGGARAELHVVADQASTRSQRDDEPSADEGYRDVETARLQGDIERWIGEQKFTIALSSDTQQGEFDVTATVTLPSPVVVVNRPLPAGAIIYAEDVTLAHVERAAKDAFRAIDQVVGSELMRPVVAGQVLNAARVRAPLMVRRGDVVDVYSYAAGIQVKTLARVKEDGARGDMVMVESVKDRHDTYRARVTGTQRVEVYARGRTVMAHGPSRRLSNNDARLRSARRGAF